MRNSTDGDASWMVGDPATLWTASSTVLPYGSAANVSYNSSYEPCATEGATIAPRYDTHIPRFPLATLVSICALLGAMIVATVLGNVFVITAIVVERSLQGVSNYLILSLAVTDLLVAVLVMPLSLLNEVSVHWYLGRALCDMWVSMDVLCCTASILHLVAIAFDRFWAVSNIDYVRRRCARQILFMIALVWLVSVVISIPPLFGWRGESDNPEISGACMISQDHGYTIFSTVGAFYCPLVLMLVLNFKIYRAARYRIRRKGFVAVTGGGRGVPGAEAGGGDGPGGGGGHARRHNNRGRVPVPTVYVEEITAQRTTRNSSGSDVSQDGYSLFNASCAQNEISRMDTGLDSGQDWNQSGYPGDSTTDGSGSNPENSYYPLPTEEEVACPLPPCHSYSSNHLTVETLLVPSRSLSECRPPSLSNYLTLDCRPCVGEGRPGSRCSDARLGNSLAVPGGVDREGGGVGGAGVGGQEDSACEEVVAVNGSRRNSEAQHCGSLTPTTTNGSVNAMLAEDQGLSCHDNHEIPLTSLQPPCASIRKDSVDDGGLLGLAPRCVTLNARNGGGSSNQLTVPRGMTPVGLQPCKSRANNNTKRAHNREKERHRREKLEMRRERKAARVLGIITGAFVVCWLPFFILALLSPFCASACSIPTEVYSLFLWLGYVNSLLNPIIYTIFNPSFRCAFRKIFFRRLRSVGR